MSPKLLGDLAGGSKKKKKSKKDDSDSGSLSSSSDSSETSSSGEKKKEKNGNDKFIALMGKGEYFGERALMSTKCFWNAIMR